MSSEENDPVRLFHCARVCITCFSIVVACCSPWCLADESTSLHLQWRLGEVRRYRTTTKRIIEFYPEGKKDEVTVTTRTAETVLSREPDGSANVQFLIEAVTLTSPTSGIAWDSEAAPSLNILNPAVLAFKALINKPISAHISLEGKVIGVSGVAQVRDGVLSTLPETPGMKPAKEKLAGMTDESQRQSFQRNFMLPLPGHPVRVGESWDYTLPWPFQETEISVTYRATLAALTVYRGRRCAKVTSLGSFQAPVEIGLSGGTLRLDSSRSDRTSYLELDSGRLVDDQRELEAHFSAVRHNPDGTRSAVIQALGRFIETTSEIKETAGIFARKNPL